MTKKIMQPKEKSESRTKTKEGPGARKTKNGPDNIEFVYRVKPGQKPTKR